MRHWVATLYFIYLPIMSLLVTFYAPELHIGNIIVKTTKNLHQPFTGSLQNHLYSWIYLRTSTSCYFAPVLLENVFKDAVSFVRHKNRVKKITPEQSRNAKYSPYTLSFKIKWYEEINIHLERNKISWTHSSLHAPLHPPETPSYALPALSLLFSHTDSCSRQNISTITGVQTNYCSVMISCFFTVKLTGCVSGVEWSGGGDAWRY